MPTEELPDLGVAPMVSGEEHLRAVARAKKPKQAFALTAEKARDLYPHLFSYPGYAEQFGSWSSGKTPEQIGKNILRHDAQWRRDRRKYLDTKYAQLPIGDRRIVIAEQITGETAPARPGAAKVLAEGAAESLRDMRETTGALAEKAVGRPERLARRLAGLPEQEPGVLAGIARGFGAEIPLLPFEIAAGAGTVGAASKIAPAVVNALRSGGLLKRVLATAGLTAASEAPIAPFAAATSPEGMEESTLQRLLLAGAFGGAVPVAGAAARGIAGAAQRGLARAVPVPQLDLSALAPRSVQTAAPEEIAAALARMRSEAVTSPGTPAFPPRATVRARGAGFEQTTPGRPPVTVRERLPATGEVREAMLQPQRIMGEVTQNQRIADLMPSERSLAEAIRAQGLEATAPGAPVFAEPTTVRARVPVAVRPTDVQPFDAGRVVLPTDSPAVAAAVRQAAERQYKTTFDGFRKGLVSPRQAARRATQAAEKAARLVRSDAQQIDRLRATIPIVEAVAEAGQPALVAAAKAARQAEGQKVAAIVGRTLTPEIRATATEAASAMRQAAQPKRTLGKLRRSLEKAVARMAARLEGEGGMARVGPPKKFEAPEHATEEVTRALNMKERVALKKRLEQDRVDRLMQEYLSPRDAAPPPPPDPPPPGKPLGTPPSPPPDSPNFIDPLVEDVVQKVAKAIEQNRLGLSAMAKVRHWFLTPAYRYRRQPELVAAMRELSGEAYIRSQMNARKAMFTLEKAAKRDPAMMIRQFRALTGEEPINKLPAQMQEHAQRIRNYVDDLSGQIQDELRKIGTPQAARRVEIIEAHLGRYLRRQYARDILGDKWKAPDDALRGAARWLVEQDLFRVERAAAGGRAAQMADESEIAGALLKMVSGDNDIAIVGRKFGRLNRSIMLHRKDIPEAIRKAMGEVQSAPAVVSMTIAQQERYLATLKFHRRIREAGLVSDVLDPARGFTKPLPESEGLGALSGTWTTPEIFEALAETTARQERAHEMLNFWAGIWKSTKLLAPAPVIRNFTGNAWFAALSGSLRVNMVGQAVDLFYRAPRLLLEHARAPVGASRGVVDEMYRHGVIGTEFVAREVQQELSDLVRVGVEFANGTTTAGWRKFGHVVREYAARAGKVYDLMDKLWKVDAYVKAKAKIARKLPQLSNDELAARAAAHVNRYFPNYELLADGVKQMRRHPLAFNPFLSFNAEVVRIHAGMLQRALTGDRDSWRAIMMGAGWLGGMYLVHRTWRWTDGINAAEQGVMADALMGDPFGRVTPQAETKARQTMRRARLAQRPFMFALSRRDEKGRVEFADLTWHLPWGDFFSGYPDEHLPAKALRWAAESFINPAWTEMLTEPFVEQMGPSGVRPGSGTETIWRLFEPRAVLAARRLAVAAGPGGEGGVPGIIPPPFGRGEQLTPRQIVAGELGFPLVPAGRKEGLLRSLEARGALREPGRVLRRLSGDPRFTQEQRRSEFQRAQERAKKRTR